MPGICTKCKYHKKLDTHLHLCRHPTTISVVDGQRLDVECQSMRHPNGLCGWEGKFFEPLVSNVPEMPSY